MMTDAVHSNGIRYAMVRTDVRGCDRRVEFDDLQPGDVFTLREPDGTVVDAGQEYRAISAPDGDRIWADTV